MHSLKYQFLLKTFKIITVMLESWSKSRLLCCLSLYVASFFWFVRQTGLLNYQVKMLHIRPWLHKRATVAAIRKNIVSCLAKLDILKKQIYSLTTDNGFNVFKVGKMIRSHFALSENFADLNDKNECGVTEASNRELWKDVITVVDGVTTVRCAGHTLQLNVHDFFKANSRATKVVSKVSTVAKKTH